MEEDHHSDDSYHMPPLTSCSVSTSSSPVESDKENIEVITSGLVEIAEGSSDYDVPLPVPAPAINFTQLSHLFAVYGQCVVCKSGPPKLAYRLYSCCCTIGAHSSTHQPGSCCSHKQLIDQTGNTGSRGDLTWQAHCVMHLAFFASLFLLPSSSRHQDSSKSLMKTPDMKFID